MMKKLLGWISALVVSVWVISGILTVVINHTSVRTHLLQLIARECGEEVVIKGEFSLLLLPRIRLSVEGVSWQREANPGVALKIERLKVALKWLPLLRGKIAIAECNIVKPQVVLTKSSTASKKADENRTITITHKVTTEWSQQINDVTSAFHCEKLLISDGSFSLLDLQGKKLWGISDLDGSWRLTGNGGDINLKIAAIYRNNELYAKKVGLKGTVDVKTHLLSVVLDELTSEFRVPNNNAFLLGKIKGKVSYEVPLARLIVSNLNLQHPVLSSVMDLTWKVNDTMPCGRVLIKSGDLKALFNLLQFDFGFKELFNKAQFVGDFNLEKDRIGVVKAELTNGKINGNLAGSYYYHLPSKLNLILEKLPLDEILSLSTKKIGNSAKNHAIDNHPKNNAKFKLSEGVYNCEIREINYKDLHFVRNRLQLKSDGKGVYHVTVVAAGCGTRPELELVLHERDNDWQGNVAVKIESLNLQQLLKGINGSEQIAGNLVFKAKLTADAAKLMDLWQYLKGTGEIAVINGEYRGLDLTYELNRVQHMLDKNVEEVKSSNPPVTTFKEFKGLFKAHNSVFESNNLVILGERFKVLGSGAIDLKEQNIRAALEAGGVVNRNFIIPIKVSGNIAKPKVSLNTAVLLGEAVKHLTSQAKQIISDNLPNQIGNLVGALTSKLK